MTNVLEIPEAFFSTRYIATRIPGTKNCSDLSLGANCQLFAYQIVKYFGYSIPDFRSSDLWEDEHYTFKVDDFLPLDLMLYHHKADAYGAHVGVFLGDGKVVHLAQRVGQPEIIDHADFLLMDQYAYFIGAKRLRKIASPLGERLPHNKG
jgi:cell wall-associated NlpC family hydrolase